ncbi:DUF4142 domain-containing protein [Deinococcus ficus]|uniref:DUF4142 domain-containing protein n=1 Tax=Deinococcus ficus TaxID=317577 RepID=A0A221SUN7_9DEIO|nr:DUF4142 domain-containing protein [Deinococcus ficus]ASN80354.1 hypothetical protein DFI_04435 [Deinococcus ficus]
MKNLTRLTWPSLLLGLTLGTAAHALGGASAPPPAHAASPCGLPAQSTPAGAAGARPTPSDLCFAQQAASGDLFEIQSSQLALTRAASPDVRAYAQQLIADHTAASQRLKALASGLQVPLPTAPQRPHAALLTQLGTLQGAAFDQAYMAAQLTAHEQAVNLHGLQSGRAPAAAARARRADPAPPENAPGARPHPAGDSHAVSRASTAPGLQARIGRPSLVNRTAEGRQAKRKQASRGTP